MDSIKSILVILASILLIWSCETREPGCLDILAENYDVNAITECDSCCLSPSSSLRIGFFYEEDTVAFTFGTKFPFGTDSIEVDFLQIPFSEFSFIADGEPFPLEDTIRGVTPRVNDDFLILESTDRVEAIGRSNFIINVDSVEFRVGLDPVRTLSLRPFEDITAASNFIDVIEDMYVDSTSTLVQARVRVTIADSTRMLEIMNIGNPEITINSNLLLQRGMPWTVEILMDVRQLLEGINPSDTNEVMAATIGENISSAIRQD